jgi:hypothetical protein
MLRATMTTDGRVVGTWRAPRSGVELEPFGRLGAGARAAFEEDAAAVERFG